MVKKRLFLLVLLQVASILVSSQGDGGADFVDIVDPSVVEDPAVESLADNNFVVDEANPEIVPVTDEVPVFEEIQPLEDPIFEDFPMVDSVDPGFDMPVLELQDEVPQEDAEGEKIITIIKKKKKKKKKTTVGPFVACLDRPDIIEAKAANEADPMEGYTADQCAFLILDENCAWEYRCGMIVTEAPIVEEPLVDAEEDEEPDSSENDDVEECEPKKKIKFENCFLKIRGIIKKKNPKRC